MRFRIIPTLLIDNRDLVKGINFRNHTYVGDPVNALRIFNEKEVDELCILDISASKRKSIDYSLIEEMTGEAFMPLSYGGGIRSLGEVEKILQLGIEKVIFNTGISQDESLIRETSIQFGASSTVASIDIGISGLFKKERFVYIESGSKRIKVNYIDYIKSVEDMGVGEIILTSIPYEGKMEGYDYDLIKEVSSLVSVPLVANGGAGSIADFRKAIANGASAVAAGSFFVFQGKHRAVLITYPINPQL